MKLSVVIPCFHSEKTIATVVGRTISVLETLREENRISSYEFLLVNDGSSDGTYREIQRLAAEYPFVFGYDLACNAGQHNAILCGMAHVSGDLILGMDDDLQTDPSQLPILLAKLEEGYDIVYGRVSERHHSVFRNFGSAINDFTIRLLVGKPRELKAGPMYLIRRFVADEIVRSGSAYTNLQGLFLRTSARIANADIEHHDRLSGVSGYTMKKLLRLWSAFLNYSALPVRFLLILGSLFLTAGLFRVIWILCSNAGQGMIGAEILALAGILLIGQGIVGEYLVRLFQLQTGQPQYVIRQCTEDQGEGENIR